MIDVLLRSNLPSNCSFPLWPVCIYKILRISISMTLSLFPAVIMSATHPMNLLSPHCSWKAEGWTAVLFWRMLWGWEMLCFECDCDSFDLFLHVHVCIAEPLSSGPLCDCPLPNPEMSFHMWTEDLDICECSVKECMNL